MRSFLIIQAGETGEAVGMVWQTLQDMYAGLMHRLPFLVIGLIVFSVFVIAGRVVSGFVVSAGRRTRLDLTLAQLFGRIVSAGLAILGVLVSAVVIFPSFQPGDLVAGLGITSVAVGFAFKEVLQNFFAGVLLLWRRPFVVGDEIMVRNFEGRVEDITVRSTRIRTYDGERAIVPNGDVYTSCVLVRTAHAVRRLKFIVGIGYLDDIEKGRRVILDAVAAAEGVLEDPPPRAYVSELAASSVNFRINFWIDSRVGDSLGVTDRVATGIKYALDKAEIDMPYQHSVVLFHDVTGSREGDIERREYLSATNGKGALRQA